MKNIYLIFLLLFLSNQAFSQQTEKWLNRLENPENPLFKGLKTENFLTNYLKHDFSNLLIPKTDFLGYIGSDYRRIEVNFKSIKKSNKTPNLYFVEGSTTVFDNTCDFEGTITIAQVREFKNMNYRLDSMYKDAGFKAQGLVIGRYRFNENASQNHVGIFDGIMTMWWYLDKFDQINYDDISSHSSSYVNNQYVGTWTEYGKSKSRVCNWGEIRIPFSGDLDIGAGEFSVNPKYFDKGWQNLR